MIEDDRTESLPDQTWTKFGVRTQSASVVFQKELTVEFELRPITCSTSFLLKVDGSELAHDVDMLSSFKGEVLRTVLSVTVIFLVLQH